MAKYRVCFSGFAYIEADDEMEAEDKFWDDPSECYQECKVDEVEEVDEFIMCF